MTTKPQTVIPAGIIITKCPARRAKGLKKETMRARGGTRLPVNKRPVKEEAVSTFVAAIASLPSK